MELHLSSPPPLENEEVASLKRIFRMQLAVLGSVIAHLVVVILLLLFPDLGITRIFVKKEADKPSAPIANVVPLVFEQPKGIAPPPPQAPQRPEPREMSPQFERLPPPVAPSPDARYRMKPTGKIPEAPQADDPPPTPAKPAGRDDARPAGGVMGGDLPRPTPGSPQSSSSSTPISPPDLAGRLRDFKSAYEDALKNAPPGPKGGGQGSGGATLDPSRLPATGYGVGNLEFESRDYDWGDYGRAIYIAIWRAWHNRLWISTGVFERWAAQNQAWLLDHNARVRFTITKSGQVVGVAIETASGCYPLDDSAADALREVVLPPLPDDFPRGQETVHARFIAQGDIRQMRRSLQFLKERGYF